MSIRIIARPGRGIRRVGILHTAEPTIYPDAFFTPAEIEILRTDPDLVVALLDDEFETPAEQRHLHLLGGQTAEQLAAGGAGSVPELPPVAKLEEFLSLIPGEAIIRAMQAEDSRKSAQPLYEARLAEFTSSGDGH